MRRAHLTIRMLAIGVAVAAVAACADHRAADFPPTGSCEVAAHRGNTNVPATTATENGMKAFRRAASLGVDWLETDVRSTSDDQPMLMHDPNVDQTTNGTGPLAAMTSRQARRLRLLDGSRIPFVTELLALAQREHTKVLLELMSPGGPLWWKRVAAAVRTYGGGRVVLQAMSTATLDQAATYFPGVPRALVHWYDIPVGTALRYGAEVIDQKIVGDSYPANLVGVEQFPYLINDRSQWDRVAGHAAATLTNKPAELMKWRETTPVCQRLTPG